MKSNIGLDYGEPDWTSAKSARREEARVAELADAFLDMQRKLTQSTDSAAEYVHECGLDGLSLAGEFLHLMAKLRMGGAKRDDIGSALESLYERTVARMAGDENWNQY